MARKISSKHTDAQLRQALEKAITSETAWSSIMEAVSKKHEVKNWMSVRNVLQAMMDDGEVVRVGPVEGDELYTRYNDIEFQLTSEADDQADASYQVIFQGVETVLNVQDARPYKGGLVLQLDKLEEEEHIVHLAVCKTWKEIRTAILDRMVKGVTEVSNIEATPVNLTDAGKKWVNEQCRAAGLNVVGKTTDQRLCLLAAHRAENVSVVAFLANGGKIDEVPGFEGIKPLPNRKETCAGGKVSQTAKKPSKEPKEQKDRREPGRRKTDAHGVSLHEICEELDVEPRIARRKLRGSDITKPGDSWEWPAGHADIQKVKDLLKK